MTESPNPSKDMTALELSETSEGFFARILEQPARAREGFLVLKSHLAEEGEETKVMLTTYRKSLVGKATDEEQAAANAQFLDVLRMAGMATFCSFIPGSMLMLPLAITAAKKMGIRLLPTAFDEVD